MEIGAGADEGRRGVLVQPPLRLAPGRRLCRFAMVFLGDLMLIGYVRVSTLEQNTHLQYDALKKAGVMRIYEDKSSGAGKRPNLQTCLNSLKSGDVLIVWKLDRIARSLKDLLRILDRLKETGAEIRSLSEPLDTATPLGIFMIQILGAVAELERNMIRERVIAGLISAHKRGVKLGKKSSNLSEDTIKQILHLRNMGYSFPELARIFSVSTTTIYRYASPTYKKKPRMPILSQYMT